MNKTIHDDPECWQQKKSHRLEGTTRIVRGRLGECPRGWHVARMDLTLFYRPRDERPLAFGIAGSWLKIVRLDKRGYYRTPRDGRYAILYCANVQAIHPAERPWWPAINWLSRLTGECEITVIVWAERGERMELDRLGDWFRPLPHAYPAWDHRVTETHWLFKKYRRSPGEAFLFTELPAPELPPVMELRQQ